MTPRDALRKKLREKRLERTGGGAAPAEAPSLARQLKADPTGALLAMGIDDVSMLDTGKALIADPRHAQRLMRHASHAPPQQQPPEASRPPQAPPPGADSSDDGEACPPSS